MAKNLVASGTISKLVKPKGFGFIRCAGGYELYFNRSYVEGDRFNSLTEGENVAFKVAPAQKGLQAVGVKPEKKKTRLQV
jgi:cold shock CspA family protein